MMRATASVAAAGPGPGFKLNLNLKLNTATPARGSATAAARACPSGSLRQLEVELEGPSQVRGFLREASFKLLPSRDLLPVESDTMRT